MSVEQDTGALPRRSARLAVHNRSMVPPRSKYQQQRLSKRTTQAASSTALTIPVPTGVLPACPVQGALEPLADYLGRPQVFTDAVATAKAQQEAAQAERQRLANEAAAQAQQTAEADAAARDRRNAASTESLIQHENQWTTLLEGMFFVPTEAHTALTQAEGERSNLATLMLSVMRGVMWNNKLLQAHPVAERQQRQKHQQEVAALTVAVRDAATQQQQQQQLLNSTLARINGIEAKTSAAPGCTTDATKQLNERIDHVVTIIGQLGDFTSPASISSTVAAIKTSITNLQTRPDAATKNYKMSHFDISKFNDYNKSDALTWWQCFLTEASCRTVPADDMMKALYLQLIGGAQAWMNHLAATKKCTIAELHTHIPWKEFEKLWFTRFMVRNVVKAAMNEVYTCSQGNMPTRDWTTKWQKIVTTPGFDLSLGPRVRRKTQPTQVTLADGRTQKSLDRCVDSVPVYFAPLACEPVSFDILDTKFDMVLGMSWLRSADHPVNFHDRTVHICDRNGLLGPCTVATPHTLIACHVVSVARIHDAIARNDVEEMGLVFLHALPSPDGPAASPPDPRITHLLDEYGDVFEDPTGTVPDRPIRHGITLEAGVVPPRGCIYRMSEEELEDVGQAHHHLRAVLNRLRLAKYKANRDKCEFAKQELEYLGHYVTPKGIRPLADKIQAIVDWPEPRCTTDVRSFMSLAGYYRRFVESYSNVAAPLSRLQSPKVPFEFDNAARGLFTTLKAAMQAAPALRIYDPTLPTQVTTDASGYSIGVVLEQCHEDGWHSVEYFSQKVPLVNTLDDARKKELLAFVNVFKWWRQFLLGCRRFKWNTDNNPLTFYKTQDTVTSTIGRWMYYIDQFDFDPCHIPGPANRAADALSRRPDFCAIVTTAFDLDNDLQPHFIKGYKSDPTYSTLYAELSSDHPPASHYPISDGFLLLHTRGKDLLVVPQDRILRTRLLGEFHDARLSAHFGVNRKLARLRQRFHWPNVLHDVTRYIESCVVCHRNKGRSRVPFGELKPLPIPRAPRLSIVMDVTGPFPLDRLGHDGILTVVDHLSKYARFFPCKYHAAAPELARLLHTSWITNQGVPEDIVSDRDTRFMSAFWTSLMAESGMTMKPSSDRHPQTDGQTERAHQTTQMMLRMLIRPDQKDWVDRLPDIEFAYNTSVHPAICVTPFELHHGGENARIFADLLLPQAADIDIPCSPASDISRKLLPKWSGPREVTFAVRDDPAGPSFVINIPTHLTVHRVFHASKLAVYTPPSTDEFTGRRSQDPPSMDGHQEVDRVITHGNKPMQFKVTFKQCAPDNTQWFSSADLQTSAPLIFADYEKRRLAKEAARPSRPIPVSDRQLRPRREEHYPLHPGARGACRRHSERGKEMKEKELLKKAKLRAIAEEQAAKRKKLEEEMMRLQKEEEEKRRAVEEAAAEEEEVEEVPLDRRRREERGESNGTKGEDAWMEKKISEWVVNLSFGEDEEALMYVPHEEREAFARELEAMADPLDRQTAKDEKKLEWKLR
ncbi:hypothetical protein CBR_g17618 [Chara braunii]|uniref:Integrase catalytic domain-containing protein n=1 Tax=Chara braunii TaxID=69332 RepID=A0A388KV09_CHABU|nr:hypothetical protein CBR_g17618 [Chara braunii]|eukprot:GBG73904.1 hypothetical protein CBR_g17618 [Chara braunii]